MQERIHYPRPRYFAFWLGWTLANGAGGALVGALEEGGFQFFATLVLSGPILGIAQWFVLRHYLRGTGIWILLSTVGWWLGINLGFLLDGILDLLVQGLLAIAGLWEVFWLNTVKEPVTLAVLGAAQWLILRRHFQGTGWWILASAAAGAVKGAGGSTVCAIACQAVALGIRNGQAGAMAAAALSSGAGWAGYGAVTGILLVWLLRDYQNHGSPTGRAL